MNRLSFYLSPVLFSLLLATLPAAGLFAQEEDRHGQTAEGSGGRALGTISFPTTTELPEAQNAFIQGMLLLHLFEYAAAREHFLQAQSLDGGYAMAYWGEAMTHNHPLWDQQNLLAGRQALLKLAATPQQRQLTTPAARERGLLAAVDILYGEGSKAERDRAYMQSMERLAMQYPQDHEVQLFYALSLLGVQAGLRDTATYMHSTAISQDVFSENPQHPGAAHYLIHGVDDPVHAVLGLSAARALAELAPDAGHAQHMTSHIFTALGMWDDVVVANEAAVKVHNSMRVEKGLEPRNWGHYNYWLLYGYLQQGRHASALELLTAAYREVRENGKSPKDRMILDPDRSLVGSVVQMWARYIIETRSWDSEVGRWSFNSGAAFDPNLTISFIRAMQAANSSMAAEAGEYLAQFQQLKFELQQVISNQQEKAPKELLYLDRLAVMEQELLAAVEMARGNMPNAIRIVAEASRLEGEMPHSFGPPYIDLPAAEYLGDLYLATRKYPEAKSAYETQLKRSRLRARSLLGLLKAEIRLGNESKAGYHREKLDGIWLDADEEIRRKIPDQATVAK